jgi:hypothetical protein
MTNEGRHTHIITGDIFAYIELSKLDDDLNNNISVCRKQYVYSK